MNTFFPFQLKITQIFVEHIILKLRRVIWFVGFHSEITFWVEQDFFQYQYSWHHSLKTKNSRYGRYQRTIFSLYLQQSSIVKYQIWLLKMKDVGLLVCISRKNTLYKTSLTFSPNNNSSRALTANAHSKAVNPAVPNIIACLVLISFGFLDLKS